MGNLQPLCSGFFGLVGPRRRTAPNLLPEVRADCQLGTTLVSGAGSQRPVATGKRAKPVTSDHPMLRPALSEQ